MARFDNIAASAARALVSDDVRAACTYYVMHTDGDARVIRYHGPMLHMDAVKLADNFQAMGHGGDVIDTPDRVKRALLAR